MNEPIFLTLDEVIESCPKSCGARRQRWDARSRLVESALASAKNTFYYGRGDCFDVAAAYAFHFAEAQAFIDGNKRTAVASALVFLARNGIYATPPKWELYLAMIQIAEKKMTKAGLAAIFPPPCRAKLIEFYAPNPKSATPQSHEVVVSVRGLTKVFKDFWGRPKARAVDNVDFEVRRGEVFGLLGPNGSGKSTTVKMLLGLLYPTKGHIEVFGHSPRHVQTKSRIGYLPEESYLYRYLNSHETLDFFGNLFHLPKGERDNRAEQLLEMVGLSQTRTRVGGRIFQRHAAPHRPGAGAHQRPRPGDSR